MYTKSSPSSSSPSSWSSSSTSSTSSSGSNNGEIIRTFDESRLPPNAGQWQWRRSPTPSQQSEAHNNESVQRVAATASTIQDDGSSTANPSQQPDTIPTTSSQASTTATAGSLPSSPGSLSSLTPTEIGTLANRIYTSIVARIQQQQSTPSTPTTTTTSPATVVTEEHGPLRRHLKRLLFPFSSRRRHHHRQQRQQQQQQQQQQHQPITSCTAPTCQAALLLIADLIVRTDEERQLELENLRCDAALSVRMFELQEENARLTGLLGEREGGHI